MERVCGELDDAKAEIEKLKEKYQIKVELSESLKRLHNEQLKKIQEASAKIEKQARELNEKADEISVAKQMCEDVNRGLKEKEAIIKHLSSANDKLRFDSNEKLRKWEEENRELVYALDEANSKNMDLEQKVHAFEEEIEGLKEGLLSVSQKKCLEADKQARRSKEHRQRDDILFKLEEGNRKVEDQLKWKKEQFKHLEEAYEKLRDQLQAQKKEWEKEKCTLLDEISVLQDNLDSQTRISEGLQSRLQMCNHALAHEESRRKLLEVQLSESRSCFENVFSECEEAKSKIELLTGQRDTEIATLRDLLGTKETLYKELVYQVGKLKQENQELRLSLKEFQEAQIQEAGTSSLSKMRHKLRGLEQMHGDCSKILRAKEAKWSSQLEKMTGDLTNCRSELGRKDAVIKELKIELEGCHSLIMQLEFQNEEMSLILLVLKSTISEAEAKLGNENADLNLKNSEKENNVALLMKQLEMRSAALVRAQTDIEEEREKVASLLRKVESLNLVEQQQQLQLQKELERHKEMLEESSMLKARDYEEEREKLASLSRKVESLNVIEQQQLELHKEVERHKEMLKESSTCQLRLKEQALQMESDLKEEREKVASLSRKVESLNLVEQQQLQLQKELERHKKQALQMESDLKEEREKVASLSRKVESWNLVEQQQLQLQKELERHKEQALQMESDLKEEREKVGSLSRKVESLNLVEQQQLHLQKELERHKEMLEEQQQLHLQKELERHKEMLEEQQQLQLQKELERHKEMLEESSMLKAQDNEEEREKVASLSRKVESLHVIEQQQLQLHKELERHKEMLNESSTCQLHLKKQALQMESDLKEARNAMHRANEELAEKFCEASELEFELQIWKSVAERLKASLEENHQMRREVEASLLAQVVVEVTLKQEKESLARSLEERERRMEDLQQQLVSLDQELKTRETETANATRTETTMAAAKENISEDLQREIEWLEEESARRELETAILDQINTERNYEYEKHSLHRLVEKRDHKIDDLQQLVRSLEERFTNSTSSFLSQLAEKQAEINLLHKAWEKVRTAEVLKEIEIQVKNLIIVELEDDFSNLQEKLELREKSLSSLKENREEIEAELEAKQSTSDALVQKLESEKRNLFEEVKKLLSDRESLLDFLGGLSERISELSSEDMQLMGIWGRIVKAFDNNKMEIDLKGGDELFDSVKENMNLNPSPTTKKVDAVLDERSPLRALNN